MPKPKKIDLKGLRKYIVWSFDPDNDGTAYKGARGQVMVDVVMARSQDHACRRVAEARGECVTVDGATVLSKYYEHIKNIMLQKPEDIELDFRDIF